MPMDYSKYPPNWLSEIRPRIMKRANNRCEFEGCGFEHGQSVLSVLSEDGKRQWYTDIDDFLDHSNHVIDFDDMKPVKVIITIMHLDHDEENHEVKDDRLKAACQLHHLRYDAREKVRRRTPNQMELYPILN